MLFNLNKGAFGLNSFSYSVADAVDFGKRGAEWMMAIKASGTLHLNQPVYLADLCIVGGGNKGTNGATAVTGGTGGQVVEPTPLLLPAGDYTIVIGGSGQDTTLTGPNGISFTATHGGGKAGGSVDGDGNGGDGDYPWGDNNTVVCTGWCFGSGGGRGAYDPAYGQTKPVGNGGSVGNAPVEQGATPGRGGYSTWDGSTAHYYSGSAGLDNTGQGGGGGLRIDNGNKTDGGVGGSGIVLIRPHKEVSA